MIYGSYWPEQCRLKCDWLNCYAGLGLVGHGHCFAGGAWWAFCCAEFIDEDDYITDQENEQPDFLTIIY